MAVIFTQSSLPKSIFCIPKLRRAVPWWKPILCSTYMNPCLLRKREGVLLLTNTKWLSLHCILEMCKYIPHVQTFCAQLEKHRYSLCHAFKPSSLLFLEETPDHGVGLLPLTTLGWLPEGACLRAGLHTHMRWASHSTCLPLD